MADRIPPMTHATGSPVVDNTNILTAGRRGQQHKHAKLGLIRRARAGSLRSPKTFSHDQDHWRTLSGIARRGIWHPVI
jgi:hypothetical protein